MGDKIIFGLIGFLLGGMGGFFIGGAVCANQYKKTIDSLQMEVDALKEENRRIADKKLAEREKAVQKAEVRYRVDEIIKKEGYSQDRDGDKNDDKEEDDEQPFDPDEEVEFDDPFDGADPGPGPEDKASEFRILTDEEYNDHTQFANQTESLTYYQQDGVLADAFDEPLKDGVNLIGAEAMILAKKTDSRFIYVWDNTEEILYDVEINHLEAYSDVTR